MLRSLLRAGAALGFAALLAPGVPSAAPGPGIAYDEIVRVVAGAAPPPGSFQAEIAALSAPATPASAAAGAVRASLGTQFGALAAVARTFLTPRLLHYAYWNGWERIDDVTAQTSTIRTCDAGHVFRLDLVAKTYTVEDPSAEPAPQPDSGTALASLAETTKSLGQQTIENEAATGYDTATSFTVAQSTGSCRDGTAAIETVQYLATIPRPTVNLCPVRRPPLPTTAAEAVLTATAAGCRPAFSANRTGPTPPSSRLALYSLVTLGTGNGVGFLTERGNLKPLGEADAGLFTVPEGFARSH